MTKEPQKYHINERHQLIDLNKDLTNFKLKFECESDDEYRVYVANQGELDTKNMNELPMKVVKGKINGNIVADKNVYQNYFLILQSLKPAVVTVKIDLEAINILETPPLSPQPTTTTENFAPKEEPVKKSTNYINLFLWIGILALVIFILYIFLFKKPLNNNNIEQTSIIDDINNNIN